MIQQLFTHAMFAVFLLLAVAGSAKAEIVQCIGNPGSTIFSDAPCAVDANTVLAPAPKRASSAKTTTLPQKEKSVTAEKARAIASANRLATKRGLPLDDATLQSARFLTESMDSASKSARQQTMAALAVYP